MDVILEISNKDNPRKMVSAPHTPGKNPMGLDEV
jgi:hypothetical protein